MNRVGALNCQSSRNVFSLSSRLGDVDDLPDIRVDASSPGPRVTFNIQDTVLKHISLQYNFIGMLHQAVLIMYYDEY